jgi:hypothetical protein
VKIRTLAAMGDQILVVGEVWPAQCQEGCDGPIAVREWTSANGGATWKSRQLAAEIANHDPPLRLEGGWLRMSKYGDVLEISGDQRHWEPAWGPEAGHYAQPVQVRMTAFGAVAVGYVGDYEGGLVLLLTCCDGWTQSVGWPDLDAAAGLYDVASSGSTLVATGFRYGAGGRAEPYVLVSPPLD